MFNSFSGFSDQSIINIFVTNSQLDSLNGFFSNFCFLFDVLSEDSSFRDSVDNFCEVVGHNDIVSILIGLFLVIERLDAG